MDQYSKIFQQKLSHVNPVTKIPVACSIQDICHIHHGLLISAKNRKQTIEEKNKRVAQENIKYRQQLQDKLDQMQRRHQKNRKDSLNKIIKSEERRDSNRKLIKQKHNDIQKNENRERLKQFKDHHQHMHDFWSTKKKQTEEKFNSQTSAKPLYDEVVERKTGLWRQNSDRGLQVRDQLLKRHNGRADILHGWIQRKKEEVHSVHKQRIVKSLKKHQEIFNEKIYHHITKIGSRFESSQQLLNKQQKLQQKKLNDKVIDDYNKRQNIKSAYLDKLRSKSAAMSQCSCKKINNIEEGLVKSVFQKQKVRNSLFVDTLQKHGKSVSEVQLRRSQFSNRKQSLFSSVLYNKQSLKATKHSKDSQLLQRQKAITQALALKKSIQIHSNCLLRQNSVK